MHHAAFHQKREVLPIKVAPLEPDDLTNPQPETGGHQNHRAIRLRQLWKEHTDLPSAEGARYGLASRRLAHQINRIAVRQFPAPGMHIDKVEQAPNVDLTLGCQGKRT